jgi:hypothetical protein
VETGTESFLLQLSQKVVGIGGSVVIFVVAVTMVVVVVVVVVVMMMMMMMMCGAIPPLPIRLHGVVLI